MLFRSNPCKSSHRFGWFSRSSQAPALQDLLKRIRFFLSHEIPQHLNSNLTSVTIPESQTAATGAGRIRTHSRWLVILSQTCGPLEFPLHAEFIEGADALTPIEFEIGELSMGIHVMQKSLHPVFTAKRFAPVGHIRTAINEHIAGHQRQRLVHTVGMHAQRPRSRRPESQCQRGANLAGGPVQMLDRKSTRLNSSH